MLYRLKASFQKFADLLAGDASRVGSRLRMTANLATFLGWVFAVAYAASLYSGMRAGTEGPRWLLLLVPFWGLARLIMNALDGLLARRQGTASVAGDVGNEASDILGDTLCYGVLFWAGDDLKLPVFVFLLCAWAAEFFGVLGRSLPGGARRHESVAGGKPERMVWVSVCALAVYFRPDAREHLPCGLDLVSILVALTAGLRARKSIVAARGHVYESKTPYGK